jgi:hypothetical protein
MSEIIEQCDSRNFTENTRCCLKMGHKGLHCYKAYGQDLHPVTEKVLQEIPSLIDCSEIIRNEILRGNVYAMGIAMGLGSLAKQHWSDK